MFLFPRRKLRHSVELLNLAVGKHVPYEAIDNIVLEHKNPRLLAKILTRVLEYEADPQQYSVDHPYKQSRKYNHKCDYQGSLLVSKVLSLFFDPCDFRETSNFNPEFVSANAEKLAADGYFPLQDFVDSENCDKILGFMSQDEIQFREDLTGKIHRGYTQDNVDHTSSNCCRIVDQSVLLSCPEIVDLVFDPRLLAIAQDFLGAPPIHTQVTSWWSVGYSDSYEYVSAGAQRYHQDRDYIKFVKLFFYLTDVDDDSGPHQFIAGSNVDYAAVSNKGYRSSKRLQSDFLHTKYDSERFHTFTAPRGTVLVEDTSGFHRGAPVKSGHRLLLQVEFVSTRYSSRESVLSKRALDQLPPEMRKFDRLISSYA